jgi:hypothetical protein
LLNRRDISLEISVTLQMKHGFLKKINMTVAYTKVAWSPSQARDCEEELKLKETV